MKLTKFKYSILLLFLLFLPLKAKYCIQVLTMHETGMDFLINEAQSVQYRQFSKVRVERRGHYFTLRIGDYKQYKNAQKALLFLKRSYPEAYLRKCEIQPEKIVFMKKDSYDDFTMAPQEDISAPNNKQRYTIQSTNEPVTVIPDPIPLPERQMVQTKQHLYEKPEEIHYTEQTSSQKSLWDECKRCFAPVYEEESADVQEYQTETQIEPSSTVPVQKREEIEVKVQSSDKVSDDAFWSQDKNPNRKIKAKKKNIYNIDEQYLP